MRIHRTYDSEIIKWIMTEPSIYPHITDDGSPKVEDFSPAMDESIYYLLVMGEGQEVLGLFLVHPHNTILYEIHTCLLPICRGEKADEAAKTVLEWIFENVPCAKLMTHVPDFNKAALKYAKRAGMIEEGVNRQSFIKGGELHDQILLGITRTEQCQQQQQP